ncbi:hypothetical protein KR067_012599 [Drosophila pandora]|nr:hypothetical protein KR067_012599 [Drosophila pandora]
MAVCNSMGAILRAILRDAEPMTFDQILEQVSACFNVSQYRVHTSVQVALRVGVHWSWIQKVDNRYTLPKLSQSSQNLEASIAIVLQEDRKKKFQERSLF